MEVLEIPLHSIEIPPARQRRDLGDIEGLANSILKSGLLQPIIVNGENGNYVLVAGERRLRAHQHLGWPFIEAIPLSTLSPEQRVLIELEENIRRKQLSWQEEVRAIREYARIARADESDASLEKIGKVLNITGPSLSAMISVAEAMEDMPSLAEANSWSSAYSTLRIKNAKALDSAFEELLVDAEPEITFPLVVEKPLLQKAEETAQRPSTPVTLPLPPPVRTSPFSAEVADFALWAKEYKGKRFNFIHCDFPYGQNMDSANLQNSANRWEEEGKRYDDSPELFDRLCRAFFDHQEAFRAESAHCIFWLAHKNYGKLASRFTHYGWTVCETPLIWHKTDNAGIAPDVRRWPRRTYEIAVFASFGDRKIAKVKAASYAGPTTKEHHLSEKPLEMLSHFFEMVVDEHTEILDPTCGGGTALRAAKALGARSGLGLDVMEKHVQYTTKMCL
jgi:ParB/RepB/Spo0J family partition protein